MGIYSRPRVWWMFRTMGHDNIAVLDGGFPGWVKQGFEVEPIQTHPIKEGNFKSCEQSLKDKLTYEKYMRYTPGTPDPSVSALSPEQPIEVKPVKFHIDEEEGEASPLTPNEP